MGMDIYGISPSDKVGEYFRNNVWYWHPLWDYCCDVDSELCDKVPNGHSNDGDGLDNCEECYKLADKLQHSIDTSYAEFYISQRNLEIENTPSETCDLCQGSGVRIFNDESITCNGCEGKGERKNISTWYKLDIENIKNFIEFLKNCGGFKIC